MSVIHAPEERPLHVRLLCPCDVFQYRVKVKNNGSLGWLTGTRVRLQLDANLAFDSFPANPLVSTTFVSPPLPSDIVSTAGGGNANNFTNPDCTPPIPTTGQLIEWQLNVGWPSSKECEFEVNLRVAAVTVGTTMLMPIPSVVFRCGPPFPLPVPTYTAVFPACVDEVRCSYDPNDKAVSPAGCGALGNVALNSALTYRVRFQNLGNAPARRVFIRDELDPKLEPDT